MSKLNSLRPTPAFVLALAAMFVALGSGAYAVTKAPKNSVVSKSIKDGQVKTRDLAPGAVSSAKVRNGAIGSAQVANASLGARHLTGVVVVENDSPATSDADGQTNGGAHGIADVTVTCPEGTRMLSGGTRWVWPSTASLLDANVYIQSQHHFGNGWRARGIVDFGAQGDIRLRAYAYCLEAGAS